jgi:hypothetical protein
MFWPLQSTSGFSRVLEDFQVPFSGVWVATSHFPQSGVATFRIPNLGVLGQNDIWVLALWPGTKNTIRGKVVLPSSSGRADSCESVFAHGSSVHQKCSSYALTNLLFGLCRSIWIIDPLVIRFSPHPEAPTRPSTSEVLRARERAPILYPLVVFTFEFVVKSIKEFGGVSSIHL